MASEANAEEPTMEEILASIRRIISDDEQEEEPPAEAEAAAPELEPEPEPAEPEALEEEDVLELTDIVPEEDTELGQDDVDNLFDEPAAPVAEPEEEIEEELVDAIDDDEDVVMVAREEEEPVASPIPPPPDPLLSEDVADRASSSFMSLAQSIRVAEGTDPRSLEHLVQEMLKPILRDWLDENLPSIVERLVQAEIDRVARKGRF